MSPTSHAWQDLLLPNADVRLLRNFIAADTAAELCESLIQETPWRQDNITMYGKTFQIPRLQQWYGDSGLDYTWAGIKMEPLRWTELIQNLRTAVEVACDTKFNSVLLNRYRDGNDTVGWHADDEYELGVNPIIASLSLGAERDFTLRHNDRGAPDTAISLSSGSLLVMAGTTQQHWKHQIPRRKKVKKERVNLTFRWIYQKDLQS